MNMKQKNNYVRKTNDLEELDRLIKLQKQNKSNRYIQERIVLLTALIFNTAYFETEAL